MQARLHASAAKILPALMAALLVAVSVVKVAADTVRLSTAMVIEVRATVQVDPMTMPSFRVAAMIAVPLSAGAATAEVDEVVRPLVATDVATGTTTTRLETNLTARVAVPLVTMIILIVAVGAVGDPVALIIATGMFPMIIPTAPARVLTAPAFAVMTAVVAVQPTVAFDVAIGMATVWHALRLTSRREQLLGLRVSLTVLPRVAATVTAAALCAAVTEATPGEIQEVNDVVTWTAALVADQGRGVRAPQPLMSLRLAR